MGPASRLSADPRKEPPRSPLATGEPMNDGVLGLATGVAPRGVLPSAFLGGLPTRKVAVRMETTVAAKPGERHLHGVDGRWIHLIHGPPRSCLTATLTSKAGRMTAARLSSSHVPAATRDDGASRQRQRSPCRTGAPPGSFCIVMTCGHRPDRIRSIRRSSSVAAMIGSGHCIAGAPSVHGGRVVVAAPRPRRSSAGESSPHRGCVVAAVRGSRRCGAEESSPRCAAPVVAVTGARHCIEGPDAARDRPSSSQRTVPVATATCRDRSGADHPSRWRSIVVTRMTIRICAESARIGLARSIS
jgi:hypothetical protein